MAKNKDKDNEEKDGSEEVGDERVILATGGYDHTIRFWCGYNGQCEETVSHPESQVNAMALSRDRRLLAVAGHQHIRTYAAADAGHSAVSLYEGVGGNVTGVVFQSDGVCMYSSGEDGVLRVWDTRQGRTGLSCDCGSVGVNCVQEHGLQLLAGDSSGLMHVWDMRSGVRTERRVSRNASVQDICVDAGHWVAAADSAGTCLLSRVRHEESEVRVRCHERQVISCRFSPDSTLLVTTSADCTASVWRTTDLTSGCPLIQPLVSLSTPTQRWVWDSAFSRDSHYLLTASSDATARLWNISSGECVREYTGHTKAITALAFSDGIPAS